MEIHLESEPTRSAFKRFLVDSPLAVSLAIFSIRLMSFQSEPIPYTAPSNNLPAFYGSYHQLYRLDGTGLPYKTVTDTLTVIKDS